MIINPVLVPDGHTKDGPILVDFSKKNFQQNKYQIRNPQKFIGNTSNLYYKSFSSKLGLIISRKTQKISSLFFSPRLTIMIKILKKQYL